MTGYRVMHLLPDLAVGGGQVMVLRLLTRLRQRGRGVMVASYGVEEAMSHEFQRAGIPVCMLGLRGVRQMRLAVQRLEKVAAAHHISILHTHGTAVDKILGHILSDRLNLPEVTTLHGMPPTFRPKDNRFRSWLRKFVERGVFNLDWWMGRSRLSAAVAVSDAVLQAWSPIIGKIRSGNFKQQVIHWGVDAQEFGVHEAKTLVHVREEIMGRSSSQGPLLLTASRLHASKNVEVLPLAMKTVLAHWTDAVLCIAGDGPARCDLERIVRDLGLTANIRLLGQRDDIPLILGVADLVVFPSLVEGFGMVALEALAAGTPVVCFNLPSLGALRADVNAIHVAAGDSPEALGTEICKALADPALGRRGQEAREIVLNSWSLERTADAYDAMYANLLD